MPNWLNIVTTILGAVGTIFGIFGMSAYFSERFKHKAQAKNKQEQEEREAYEKFKAQQQVDAIRDVIKQELNPIVARIDKIENNTNSLLEADILTLRCQMKDIEERCVRKGYADIGDKTTAKELYVKYKSLGGNNFKEYVDQWLEKVNDLPEKKEIKTKKSPSKKKQLLENK